MRPSQLIPADSATVYNYSWPLFPYTWKEISVQIAYESDMEFVASTMRRVVEEERGDAMTERVHVYRGLLERTPVDEIEVDDKPAVLFRTSTNTGSRRACAISWRRAAPAGSRRR